MCGGWEDTHFRLPSSHVHHHTDSLGRYSSVDTLYREQRAGQFPSAHCALILTRILGEVLVTFFSISPEFIRGFYRSVPRVNLPVLQYITHLYCEHKERILYVSAEQMPDDGFAIKQDSILMRLVDETHHDPFPQLANNHASDTEANTKNAFIDPEQPPVRTLISATPHWENQLTGKTIGNQYFNILDDDPDLWSPFSCEEEYWLAHQCVEHILRGAVIYGHFGNCMMPTVRISTLSHTGIKRVTEISQAMGIDSSTSAKVCYNCLANPNNVCNYHYTYFFYRNPAEWVEFLMQQLAFRYPMSYAPATEFNDAGNVTTLRLNQETRGGMDMNIGWISLYVQGFWPLR